MQVKGRQKHVGGKIRGGNMERKTGGRKWKQIKERKSVVERKWREKVEGKSKFRRRVREAEEKVEMKMLK